MKLTPASLFSHRRQDLISEDDCSLSAQAVDVGELGGFFCWDGDMQVVCSKQQIKQIPVDAYVGVVSSAQFMAIPMALNSGPSGA